ncbi:ATP-dependent RNA helicase SUPV3L1/SUV3 [Cognatiyoonia koreensis]|uniref:ATP-dependent RNA helicase SUPV3L1/SUV3 n=1 Tax=Cognatiyoonia koreensis TaxID=364200 RepID=A0A1I0NE02_9RHOB|nr:helicase-related protein [Cognatiyoonia koreensis]SEV99327.1 ATP-dependent RNA helicase SUPV3L1/SUV3 [Cognatiyoonia koreensis]
MNARVTAVLGPTNTGKTHYAIERMLAYRTGIIGLPLRLLAREVYDRIVAKRGPGVVALVTGEERIVPPRAAYWVCTVEAMPPGMGCDFLAIDEIQLCADAERGHIFTDRLLHARGLHETLFLGAETMWGAIASLVPEADFLKRDRFSTLTCTGSKKLSRMPARSAIVGFSVENVYAIAELLRRQKGGAAVVMGALSPRTRNAQVEMYQNGDVDYLVATDAIGMGLNLDIKHVAFSGLSKFDGRRMRNLFPEELAQIAGRAGRHTDAGTFGVTGEAPELDEAVADAITNHRFRPVTKLQWRNTDLQFGSIKRLLQTLEEQTQDQWLTRVRESDDLAALKALAGDAEVAARASDGPSVRLLWDVCRIPDFRGISKGEHANLLTRIFNDLHQTGHVDENWFALQIKRIDRSDGDIDTLSKRLAYIRTWTYVAQRKGWLRDDSHWRDATRAVEDRLSDALHGALTQRFVDRRTSVLLRRLNQKDKLLADVNDKGEVTVEGEFVGKLEGFRFRMDKTGSPDEAKTLRQASVQALVPQFHLLADRFYNAPDPEIDFTEQGGLMWGDAAVGKLTKGDDPYKPVVEAFVDDEAGPDVTEKVRRRLQHFIDRKIASGFEPLLALRNDETLTGSAKGFAFRMAEGFGIIPRGEVADEVKALDQDARGALRKHGIRFGQFTIFMPLLLKPAPTRLRLVLWSLSKGLQEFPESPPPGLVTVPAAKDAVPGYYAMAGYRAAGERAIRIDMVERLADMLRDQDSRGGFEATPDMLSITGMTLEQFANLMVGLGYKAEKGEREKMKAAVQNPPDEVPGDKPGEVPPAPPIDVPPSEEPIGVPPVEEPVGVPPTDPQTDIPPAPPTEVPEMETFFTFTWGGRAVRPKPANDRPHRKGKPKGKGPKAGGNKPQSFQAKPRKEKAIDPDNPFAAALAGFKKD